MAIKIAQDVQKSWHGCSTDRFPLPNSTPKQFHLLDLRGFYPRLRYKCIFPPSPRESYRSPTRLKVLSLGTKSHQDGSRGNPVDLRRHDVRAEIVNPVEEILPTESILENLDIVLMYMYIRVCMYISYKGIMEAVLRTLLASFLRVYVNFSVFTPPAPSKLCSPFS